MKVVRGYKTELDLNNEQRTACLRQAGTSRFAYNWGLVRSQEVYRTTGKRPKAMVLHKELNARKPSEFPWMYEVSKCAPQEASVLKIPSAKLDSKQETLLQADRVISVKPSGKKPIHPIWTPQPPTGGQ